MVSIVFSVVFCPTDTPAFGGRVGLIWIGAGSGGRFGSKVPSFVFPGGSPVVSAVVSPTGLAGTEPTGLPSVFAVTFGLGAALNVGTAAPARDGEPPLCASRAANRAASGSLPGGPAAVSPDARPGVVPAAAISPVLISGGILTSFMGLLMKVSAEEGENKRGEAQKSPPWETRRALPGTGSAGGV